MRRSTRLIGCLAALLWVGYAANQAWAFPDFAQKTKVACAACHTNPAGGAALTDAGKAYKEDATKVPEAVKGADYVGSNKCMMCHGTGKYKELKATYLASKHAKAFSALSGDPKAIAAMAAKFKIELKGAADKSDACVRCHVTGFKLAGGYPAADSAKTAAVTNVGCEACHGPGSLHLAAKTPADKKATINRAVTENLCTHCHVSEVTPKFDFEAMKKAGVHVAVVAAAPAAPEKK